MARRTTSGSRPTPTIRPTETIRVLLSEGSSLSARHTISALGRRGYILDICDPNPLCLGRFSKFVRSFYRSPALGTDRRRFRPDLDPRTKTNPLRRDTDGDGRTDGREDRNHNGRRDRGETNPLRLDTDHDGIRDGLDHHPLKPRRA